MPRTNLPKLTLPLAPKGWFGPDDALISPTAEIWAEVPSLPPFRLADDSGPALRQTVARVCCDTAALYVGFECDDPDIWATYRQRDDPIYDEEVVEVFIAPGGGDPTRYFEFEVSPAGVLLDAGISNPTSTRANLVVDVTWNCPGLRWSGARQDGLDRWWAALAIPWAAIAPGARPSRLCRANFYRIERPRQGAPEFSCWSPTMTSPADFHKPACFGYLELPF